MTVPFNEGGQEMPLPGLKLYAASLTANDVRRIEALRLTVESYKNRTMPIGTGVVVSKETSDFELESRFELFLRLIGNG